MAKKSKNVTNLSRKVYLCIKITTHNPHSYNHQKKQDIMFVLPVLIGLLFGTSPEAQSKHPMQVWYDQPVKIDIAQEMDTSPSQINYEGAAQASAHATPEIGLSMPAAPGKPQRTLQGSVWENYAFPMGNSSLGAMLLQSAAADAILLNEKSLWKGGPASGSGPESYWHADPHSARFLADIRQAFLDGDSLRADSLTRQAFSGAISNKGTADTLRFGTFTSMGEIYVRTDIDNEACTNFSRRLSLNEAVSRVSFKHQGATYRRSYFVSYPDQALVMRYEANKGKRQQLDWIYVPNPDAKGFWQYNANGMVYFARLNNNRLPYAIHVKARTGGGTVTYGNGRITVRGARWVDFIVTAATGYKPNYHPSTTDPYTYYQQFAMMVAQKHMKAAERLSYKTLYKRHVKDYSSLFNRVSLCLDKPQRRDTIATDNRIDRYRQGQADAHLEELYYQYGRYLTIQASRGETMPMNLQGMWNRGVAGPWNCDYHNNINLQMNYWPVCSANLSECFQPFVVYLKSIQEPGQRTAKAMYDARGWTTNISTNIYGFTAPSKSQDVTWNLAAINGPWLATHLWDYYEYTQDLDFLRQTAYPIIQGSARFVCDYLWRQPNGRYTAAPSTSPEHGPVDKGATFANAVARQLLDDAVKASIALQADEEERQEWQQVRNHIEPYRVGRYGQLMEWANDIDDPNDHHRHTNHLYGLYPGTQISPQQTPLLAQAARTVLEHRGDYSTGWSMGWKLNLWAHLGDGNRAYQLLQNLLKTGTLYNLWDTHPPFQIDGNMGGLSGMTEMLLQSRPDTLTLLPACPDAWRKGEVKGLRARGNYTVSLRWNKDKPQSVTLWLRAHRTARCTVRYGDQEQMVDAQAGKTYRLKFR